MTAIALSGSLGFNPITDKLINEDGKEIKLTPPKGYELPPNGFQVEDQGYQSPSDSSENITIKVNEDSERLQLLKPFKKWDGTNLLGLK